MTASDPPADWFYRVGDHVHGPVTHIELREKAAAGEIGPDTLIRSGHEEWRRAEQVYFLSEFFPPVERSEDWWQEVERSAIAKEIEECRGNLIQLVVCSLVLAGVFLVGFLLDAAGVGVGDSFVQALSLAILIFGAGILQASFRLWRNGWEATREAARMIWAELRRPSE